MFVRCCANRWGQTRLRSDCLSAESGSIPTQFDARFYAEILIKITPRVPFLLAK